MKLIVCLYGGPGTGKSTMCAGVYHAAKSQGLNAEMNREYVKDWVWEGRTIRPGDQTYLFAKQARRERQFMQEDLDLIVTDSPLIMTHYYGLKYDKFEQEFNTSLHMLAQHHAICKSYGYKVEHIFLERVKPYNDAGRFQTEEEAKQVDREVLEMLTETFTKYSTFPGDETGLPRIMAHLGHKYA